MSRQRTYSDDALAEAVASSRSWRGVLRELGLAATSSSALRSVRRQADRLGLGYGHFSGQRRWTEDELAAAIAAGSTWSDVVATLGLEDSSSKTALKGHAVRLGLDIDHLRPRKSPKGAAPLVMHADLANLPRAGSMIAAAWFALCGDEVSWPLEPCRYDLIVRGSGGVQRVQVKTGTVRAGDSWMAWLSTTGKKRVPYDPDEIDSFFVIDGDLALYLIPASTVGGLLAVSLRAYSDYKVAGPLTTRRRCSVTP